MDKIIIDPHYCSREEYQDLISHLEKESWDYHQIRPTSDNVEDLKIDLAKIIDLAEDLIEAMPQKGEKSSDCQKIYLKMKLNEFSYAVNGIEESDLIDNEE